MSEESMVLSTSNAPRKGKKYFTLEEANRAVPYISRIVDEISRSYQEAVALHQQIEQLPDDVDLDQLRDAYETSMDCLNDLIEELRHVGVEIKDFEKGLIDFPAVHDSREIYLCWHRGEASVQAWHEVDAGFAGRQDVALLGHD